MNKIGGFTLIELMLAVVVVAIITAIALPTYTQHLEKRDLAVARQEALRIASELERFKSKNFSYKGFDASSFYAYEGTANDGTTITRSYYDNTSGKLYLPIGTTALDAKYILTLVGGTGNKPLTISRGSNGEETTDSMSVNGLTWMIAVERRKNSDGEPIQPRNYDLLLTSTGIRCMTKTKNVVNGFVSCGTSDSEKW